MQLFTLRIACLLPFIIVTPYLLFITLLTIPAIQRSALYANKLNPAYFQDLSNVEQFGFHSAQVVPFTFHPEDDAAIILHAWYMLPVEIFLQHEAELKGYRSISNYPLSPQDLIHDSPLQFLISDENAQLIISFHGNAAHLASSHRPTTYQHLLGLSTSVLPVHIIAFDYRGFGLSTGSPTEEGLLADAVALLQLVFDAGIAMDRVTLLGQSLGTAVATGAYHTWTGMMRMPAPRALILLASFSNIPSLMDSYSIKGFTPPLLSGLDYFPSWVKKFVLSKIVDTWYTNLRLTDLWQSDVSLDLSMLHASDDREIPWREGWKNFVAISNTKIGNFTMGSRGDDRREGWWADVIEGDADYGRKRCRWELVKHGGHNRVAVGEQMKATVLRVLLEREELKKVCIHNVD